MSHPLHRKDAGLTATIALPASAGSTSTAGIDLQGAAAKEDFVADCDIEVVAPALTTTHLPDTETAIYKVETSADDSTYVTLFAAVITQTGAGAAGAATATVVVPLRGRISVAAGNLRRYVRVTVTTSTSAGDCSGVSVTASLLL